MLSVEHDSHLSVDEYFTEKNAITEKEQESKRGGQFLEKHSFCIKMKGNSDTQKTNVNHARRRRQFYKKRCQESSN